MDYGGRLREHRQRLKLTQDQLAKLAGIPVVAVSRMESQARKITLEEAVKLAKALHISVDELAGVGSDGLDRQAMLKKTEELKQRITSELEAYEAVLAAV